MVALLGGACASTGLVLAMQLIQQALLPGDEAWPLALRERLRDKRALRAADASLPPQPHVFLDALGASLALREAGLPSVGELAAHHREQGVELAVGRARGGPPGLVAKHAKRGIQQAVDAVVGERGAQDAEGHARPAGGAPGAC